jgi:hypothetical protein
VVQGIDENNNRPKPGGESGGRAVSYGYGGGGRKLDGGLVDERRAAVFGCPTST